MPINQLRIKPFRILAICIIGKSFVDWHYIFMERLFLDIETLPADEKMQEVLQKIHQDKITKSKKVGYKYQKSFEEYIESTQLDGTFGRILCLSYAVNDEPVVTLLGDEKKILQDFWEVAKDADLFVGFNIMEFDLRFIYQRSVINEVKPTRDLSFAKYRNEPIFDIMWEWSKWSYGSKISLDALSRAVGLTSSKQGIDGSQVSDFYKQGRVKEIAEYCKRDVEVTRQIYKKMTFT